MNDCTCRFLVSKLFDVTEDSKLKDMYAHKPIRIPYGKGIVGYVAETGKTVNIADAYQVFQLLCLSVSLLISLLRSLFGSITFSSTTISAY